MKQNVINNSTTKNASSPRTRLIELRENKGTQNFVANELGITETHLRSLEKGRAMPSVDLMFRIAKYFNTDVYDCWKDLSGSRPESL